MKQKLIVFSLCLLFFSADLQTALPSVSIRLVYGMDTLSVETTLGKKTRPLITFKLGNKKYLLDLLFYDTNTQEMATLLFEEERLVALNENSHGSSAYNQIFNCFGFPVQGVYSPSACLSEAVEKVIQNKQDLDQYDFDRVHRLLRKQKAEDYRNGPLKVIFSIPYLPFAALGLPAALLSKVIKVGPQPVPLMELGTKVDVNEIQTRFSGENCIFSKDDAVTISPRCVENSKATIGLEKGIVTWIHRCDCTCYYWMVSWGYCDCA